MKLPNTYVTGGISCPRGNVGKVELFYGVVLRFAFRVRGKRHMNPGTNWPGSEFKTRGFGLGVRANIDALSDR